MHFPSRRRKTQMKTILKAAMSYHLAQCLASLLKSTCVTHRRRVSLHIFHLWMKRKFTGKQPCQCPIYMRQQCKFFLPPLKRFKTLLVDFVSEIWAFREIWAILVAKVYSIQRSDLVLCHGREEVEEIHCLGSTLVVWVVYSNNFLKRRVTCAFQEQICSHTLGDGIFLLCFDWKVLDA